MSAAALYDGVRPPLPEPAPSLGMTGFARTVFAGGDLQPVFNALLERAAADPGAILDLSSLLQLIGQRDQGLALQADALRLERRYRITLGTGDGPNLLALVTAGDMMANTPLEFLLKGWNGRLDLLFLDAEAPALAPAPGHDLTILAIGESDGTTPILRGLSEALARWPGPVLNGAPANILALGREAAPRKLAGLPGIVAPATVRVSRAQLEALAQGLISLEGFLPGAALPLIVRPVGSHAGTGLEKLERLEDLAAYLEGQAGGLFYLTPFVDYSGPDGRFRKLRVAMIEGRPFIAHMAVSEHWMVHYLNAGMDRDGAKRAEEAAMMATFDEDFALRHATAFKGLAEAIGLDYFAIDCAEDRQGRLLIFETDTAMIIHDMDPPDLYPYKEAAMVKLFAAFQALLARRIGSAAV